MRHRSPTNSRHWENEPYRREYMDTHQQDELLRYMPVSGLGSVYLPGSDESYDMHDTASRDPHHIFGGAGSRIDKAWNLAAVCRPVHQWCHDHYPVDGKVLGLRLKLDAGIWDEAAAYEYLGFKPLGWIHGVRCKWDFAEVIRVEIIRQVEAGELP